MTNRAVLPADMIKFTKNSCEHLTTKMCLLAAMFLGKDFTKHWIVHPLIENMSWDWLSWNRLVLLCRWCVIAIVILAIAIVRNTLKSSHKCRLYYVNQCKIVHKWLIASWKDSGPNLSQSQCWHVLYRISSLFVVYAHKYL